MIDTNVSPLLSCLGQLENSCIERANQHQSLDKVVLCTQSNDRTSDSKAANEEFS